MIQAQMRFGPLDSPSKLICGFPGVQQCKQGFAHDEWKSAPHTISASRLCLRVWSQPCDCPAPGKEQCGRGSAGTDAACSLPRQARPLGLCFRHIVLLLCIVGRCAAVCACCSARCLISTRGLDDGNGLITETRGQTHVDVFQPAWMRVADNIGIFGRPAAPLGRGPREGRGHPEREGHALLTSYVQIDHHNACSSSTGTRAPARRRASRRAMCW